MTAALLQSQCVSITFETLPKSEIERRLRAYETDNIKREQKLHELFEEAGCSGDHLSEQTVKHTKAPNVICTVPGATDSAIVVGGHFDFVSEGKGVVDNWSGCSLLPSLFQSLNASRRRHTFVFVGFTDEEKGLIGSKYYVHEMAREDVRKVTAMVNLDSLGTDTTKVELDRGDKRLVNALAFVAKNLKLPLSAVNVHSVGQSDSDSFQDRKIPAISVHSVTNETFPILHTRLDQWEAIKMDAYYDSYLLLRAYLAYLDEVLDKPPAKDEKSQ